MANSRQFNAYRREKRSKNKKIREMRLATEASRASEAESAAAHFQNPTASRVQEQTLMGNPASATRQTSTASADEDDLAVIQGSEQDHPVRSFSLQDAIELQKVSDVPAPIPLLTSPPKTKEKASKIAEISNELEKLMAKPASALTAVATPASPQQQLPQKLPLPKLSSISKEPLTGCPIKSTGGHLTRPTSPGSKDCYTASSTTRLSSPKIRAYTEAKARQQSCQAGSAAAEGQRSLGDAAWFADAIFTFGDWKLAWRQSSFQFRNGLLIGGPLQPMWQVRSSGQRFIANFMPPYMESLASAQWYNFYNGPAPPIIQQPDPFRLGYL